MLKGFCGFDCSKCPTYKAWKNDDDKLRQELMEKYSTKENPLKKEDFNCSGCRSPEKIFFVHCFKCEIRQSALDQREK
jgi:hypothetical protein